MANRVSVEIDAKVQGFVDGMNQAEQSAQKYETEQRKISNSTIEFNKELRKAKKTVMDLAGGYAKLSAEEKNSAFGIEMKKQLDAAKQSAAQLVDMQGDLRTELKNLASDTHTLDMVSEGFGIIASSASTAMGIVAQFTGNEEDARKAILAFTTAESALSAATKIQNALQMQSNTMMAVTKIQTLAAAAATKIKTAAEGKNVVVTKAATIAQAALNAVAKANPYVLLATAIIGVATAIGTYIYASKNAETETEKQNRKVEEAKKQWDEYKQKVNESAASQIADFKALQREWEALKTTEEKNKFLDDNKNKFNAMGLEIDDVNELEELFVRNSAAVVGALKARAEAEAWGEIYKERLKKKLQADLNGSVGNGRYVRKAKAGDYISDDEARRANINNVVSYHGHTATTAAMSGTYKRAITEQEAARVNALRMADAQKKLSEENAELTKLQDKWTDAVKSSNEAYSKLNTTLTHRNKTTGGKGGHTSETQKEITELQKLENKVKEIEEMRANIDINAPNAQQIIKETDDALKKAKATLTKYKIAVGIEVEPSKLDKMEEELKRKELMLRADIPQEEKDKIYQEILELRDKIQKEKIAAHIIVEPEVKEDNVKVETAAVGSLKWLSDEKAKWQKQLDISVEGSRDFEEARQNIEELTKKEQKIYLDLELKGMSNLQKANRAIDDLYKIDNVVNSFNQLSDALEGDANAWEIFMAAISTVESVMAGINAVTEIANMLGLTSIAVKTGEAAAAGASAAATAAEEGAETAAEAPAVALAAANKAAEASFIDLASAMIFAAHASIPFAGVGIASGFIATMLSIQASVKAATLSMMAFAEGGIVGGSSYHGDRIMARINSGEMVLNQRQQKNLFNLLDTEALPQKGGSNVEVHGVIRGTDLILVQKNANKVRSNAGTEIKF